MIRVAHRVGALWLLASEWGGHLVVPRVVDRGLEAEAIPSATGHHAALQRERGMACDLPRDREKDRRGRDV